MENDYKTVYSVKRSNDTKWIQEMVDVYFTESLLHVNIICIQKTKYFKYKLILSFVCLILNKSWLYFLVGLIIQIKWVS